MHDSSTKIHPKALEGLELFNQQAFYDAHEYFEDAWRATSPDDREIYRALLQLSGGFFRLTQDRPDAAWKFFDRALTWLEPFPPIYQSIDVAGLRVDLQNLLNALSKRQPSAEIIAQLYHPINLTSQEA